MRCLDVFASANDGWVRERFDGDVVSRGTSLTQSPLICSPLACSPLTPSPLTGRV